MKTVGLDFGTHQTKICVEEREDVETHYSFHQFTDKDHRLHYTLPSIICICPDGRLKYGFVDHVKDGSIKRYFKQAAFLDVNSRHIKLWEAARYSIWYLAYILFDLEELYGQDFTIQMGAPSDSNGIDDKKAIAVSILASAYRLVEDVFKHDKKAFLHATYDELLEKTEIVRFSDKVKRTYGILVFPEAYACLMPLIGKGKISYGMNLVIDIGGGTTDISFFTIEKNQQSDKYHPQVYDFFSINKGLNYLTDTDDSTYTNIDEMIHFFNEKKITKQRKDTFFHDIDNVCERLMDGLRWEWKLQTELNMYRLYEQLKDRPIIYTGGGSTIKSLHRTFMGFKETHNITYDVWQSKNFDDKSIFEDDTLCPILSTAYGLSISVNNDKIEKKTFRDIFKGQRGMKEEDAGSTFGSAYGGFNYANDWDAWK